MTDPAFAPVSASTPIALIRALEERAFNAWPAHQTVFHRGWVFRMSGGYTKRANSVNALVPGAPFDGVREAAAALYARHGLPAVFRISPLAPAEADQELADAGYQHFDPSLVLHRPLDLGSVGKRDGDTVVSTTPSTAWLDGFAAANGVPQHHRALHHRMLNNIAHPAAFALLQGPQGQPVGFGLAVLERGAVGLYDLAVAPEHRGSGRGRALVQALLHWAAEAGATSAYLQVRAQNAPALGLYEAMGFKTAYGYHYRVPG
ncbi:GNAT family N-acetyltransferase [Acidovorax sp.]|uniref:GNAT family N-acetyltransferase n=1 Tax=Acidovorax sp. TaxID=1872122 RepID=UPI002632EA8B|nr:GNAT family N-acetyltransferase [Acidovorax sp.]